MKTNLKFICQDIDRHGNVRTYVRKNGRKIRLRSAPSTPEFFREYEQAISNPVAVTKPVKKTPNTSFRWLVESYYKSGDFKRLADSTKAVRRRILDGICEAHGNKPFASLEKRHILMFRDEKADKPEGANGLLKALKSLFKWALESEKIKQNPTKEVPKFKVKTDGHHTWTIEEVIKFEQRHPPGTKANMALSLLLYTGVRRSDVVRLGHSMEHGEWLHFTEAKGEKNDPKNRKLPILPILREVIDKIPASQSTYLITEYRKPFTPAGFGNWFRDRCDEAGLKHCSAHGLRKAGATFAAENGATEHQLMAIFGWKNVQQAEVYTRKARERKLLIDSMHRISGEQQRSESVPPANKK